MELAQGGSLLDYVRQRKRLAEPEACFFLQQIVHGLMHCHNMEVRGCNCTQSTPANAASLVLWCTCKCRPDCPAIRHTALIALLLYGSKCGLICIGRCGFRAPLGLLKSIFEDIAVSHAGYIAIMMTNRQPSTHLCTHVTISKHTAAQCVYCKSVCISTTDMAKSQSQHVGADCAP